MRCSLNPSHLAWSNYLQTSWTAVSLVANSNKFSTRCVVSFLILKYAFVFHYSKSAFGSFILRLLLESIDGRIVANIDLRRTKFRHNVDIRPIQCKYNANNMQAWRKYNAGHLTATTRRRPWRYPLHEFVLVCEYEMFVNSHPLNDSDNNQQ